MMKYSLVLVFVNLVVFAVQTIYPSLYTILALNTSFPYFYQIISTMFVHSSLMHLSYNMISLFLFGLILEKEIGSEKFLFVYFVSGLVASLVALFFYPHSYVVGASGAIYGVMATIAILRPRLIVWFLGVPMYMLVAFFIWIFFSILGIFSVSDIAHISHLSGLIIGAIFGFYFRRKTSKPLKVKQTDNADIDEESMEAWENKYL